MPKFILFDITFLELGFPIFVVSQYLQFTGYIGLTLYCRVIVGYQLLISSMIKAFSPNPKKLNCGNTKIVAKFAEAGVRDSTLTILNSLAKAINWGNTSSIGWWGSHYVTGVVLV